MYVSRFVPLSKRRTVRICSKKMHGHRSNGAPAVVLQSDEPPNPESPCQRLVPPVPGAAVMRITAGQKEANYAWDVDAVDSAHGGGMPLWRSTGRMSDG
jgi:hypothetical protein